jgi:ornithine cyclodeaminase
VLAISAEQLRRLVPMRDAISAMRDAFTRVADGSGELPHRVALSDGTAIAMMARGSESAGTAVKVVAVRNTNRGSPVPTIHALVVWLDGTTGEPKLLIEGSSLTALRTGAASGLATDLLAPRGARVLAVIGAGAQAPDQVRSVLTVREISAVRICSRGNSSARVLAARLAREFPDVVVEAVANPEVAVHGADVVSCATNAKEPVLVRKGLNERVHVNAVGSYRPEMRELSREVLSEASIVAVDQRAAALQESGELIDAVEHTTLTAESLVELGQLVRTPPSRIGGLTVFKSVGVAMQDWAIAQLVSERIGSLTDVAEVRL